MAKELYHVLTVQLRIVIRWIKGVPGILPYYSYE